LRQFAKARDPAAERALAVLAVANVRRSGGVLEHPAESTLWAHCGLPRPGAGVDAWGGWTLEIRQCDWGHRAEKLTWLYIVGVPAGCVPLLPARSEPTGVIKPRRDVPRTLPIITKAQREHTPPALAVWLVELARLCWCFGR
jgi:hypothetical protein